MIYHLYLRTLLYYVHIGLGGFPPLGLVFFYASWSVLENKCRNFVLSAIYVGGDCENNSFYLNLS